MTEGSGEPLPRKSKQYVAPPRHPLLTDVFPALARQILLDLRKLKRLDLADQIKTLEIVGRCRCGRDHCGTFHTMPLAERQKFRGDSGAMFPMCGAILTEAKGHIVNIETLDPQVESILRQLIP